MTADEPASAAECEQTPVATSKSPTRGRVKIPQGLCRTG